MMCSLFEEVCIAALLWLSCNMSLQHSRQASPHAIHCYVCSMYRWSLALDLVFLCCCNCAYDFRTDSTQRLAWCVVCLRKFVLRLYFDCHVTCHYNTQGRRLPMPLGSHYRNFIKPCEKKYGVFPVQERKHLYKFWITMAWMKWPYNIISKIG